MSDQNIGIININDLRQKIIVCLRGMMIESFLPLALLVVFMILTLIMSVLF